MPTFSDYHANPFHRQARKRSMRSYLYSRQSKYVPRAITKKTQKPKVNNLKFTKPMEKLIEKRLDRSKQDHWKVTKYQYTGLQGIPHTNALGAPSGLFPIIPKIGQVGSTQVAGVIQQDNIESREGNSVKLKSITANLNLLLSPTYSSESSPNAAIRYKVLILSCKKYSQYNTLVENFFDTAGSDNLQEHLFRDGASAVAWDENMENFDLPVNTDLFTVHAQKTGKLNRGMNVGDSADGYTLNPMPNVTLKLRIKCKSKQLKYDTPDSTLPTNFNPLIWVGYKAYDGTLLHSGNFFKLVGNSVIHWEDM